MTLRQRLDRLEAAKPNAAEVLTPEMRDALDRLRVAKADSPDAEAKARLELADILTDMEL